MLDIRLLGQFDVLRDGRRLDIPTRNAQSLFAYLVLNQGKAHRRERLAGLLWPNSGEENARSNLRHELWRLRKSLDTGEGSYFAADDLAITFIHPEAFSLDVHKLEAIPLDASTVDDLFEALSSYGGELLPGFYDEWVLVERERLAILYEAKMTRLLESLQREGRWGETQEWAMRWAGMGQWPEPAYRALMTAYANMGDISKAVATYERFSLGLQKELGVKPSDQTQALFRRLKSGRKEDGGTITGVFGTQATKPSNKASSPAFPLPKVRRSNLPNPLTSFIGREKEIQEIERLVSSGRLITITGPGGVGKTRLAIQVSRALLTHYADGVWWVGLAALFKGSSPATMKPGLSNDISPPGLKAGLADQIEVDLVAQAVAKALRIPESLGLTVLEGTLEYLHDKQVLLILDNCEHLIEECAALVERLLSECPNLAVLATSREALGVPGEKAWLLPSLSLPGKGFSLDLQSLRLSEAASLFIERTADALPTYSPGEADAPIIAKICLRLDGIPLAIELAAARMSLLSAREIADRLDQRFSLLTGGQRTALLRHQTLRAAIEWSFDLLSEQEQVLFRRLSIFAGSFSLEAAETICIGPKINRDEVLTLVGRLVAKSLLNVEPLPQESKLSTRYRFLDTIHSFGKLKLEEAGETGLMRTRHANYYVHLAETAEPVFFLQNQVRWIKLLQAEYDNMRAVIEWSAEIDQAESALRVVASLLWFWWLNGFVREGRDLALKALDLPSAMDFGEIRARALNTAGFMQYLLGDTAAARQLLEEALSILRMSDDEVHLAWSLQFLGLVFAHEKEFYLADIADQESRVIINRLKERNTTSLFFLLGDIDLLKGDFSRAIKVYEENVVILRETKSRSTLAYPVRRLGYLALRQNDLQKARRYFRESLSLNHEVGDMPGIIASLLSMAVLAMNLGRPIIAARLYGAVESRLDRLLINLLITDQAELRRIKNELAAALDDATFTDAFTEGWEMSEEQAIELAEGILKIENGGLQTSLDSS